MMHSLAVFGRPTGNEAFRGELTAAAHDWRRTTRALGGFWLGSFSLSAQDFTRRELFDFYESSIGYVVREYAAGGLLTWEGIVTEMRLLTDGAEFMLSLRPKWWHNNIKVIYRSIVDGSRQTITWTENTDASDEFGEMQLLIALPATTSAAATAKQGVELGHFAWPRSRPVNSLAFAGSRRVTPDRLLVRCAGFWHTMNWLYQETNLTDTADDIITTLVGNSEFVTAGRIETNTLSTYVEASPNPVRLGTAIEGITAQGDASLNLWECGVYDRRELVYEQSPSSIDYYIRGPDLVDKAGSDVLPPLLKPGFLVYNSAAPVAVGRPGTASVWDDPQVGYVDQVEFIAPDGLRLRLYDEEETTTILGEQIRRETALQRPLH